MRVRLLNYKYKKKPKKNVFFLKRMLCIIRERMQMFAYVYQTGRARILGTMVYYDALEKDIDNPQEIEIDA